MALNPLMLRIVTAATMVALLLPAFLLLPKGFGVLLITLFVAGAAWEWAAFFGWQSKGQRFAYVGILLAALGAAWVLTPALIGVATVAAASMLWWTVALLLIMRYPVRISPLPVAVAGLLIMVPAWVSLVALLNTEAGGRRLLLLALAIVWAADVGAYFAGRQFGRVKLAPQISPGKTWEGVFGGLLAAVAVAVAGAAGLQQPVLPAIALGLSVAALSIVGDLTESVFKRNAGVKDSGTLIPGHGGVLDRVDSVTAAVPLFVLEAGWLGWLG